MSRAADRLRLRMRPGREPSIRLVSVTQHNALCRLCLRLFEERAVLLLEYHAALDALDATSKSPSYAARWAEVSRLSERLDEVVRVERGHHERHRKA